MDSLDDLISAYERGLMNVVAPKLAGRPVTIEWRAPYIKGVWGLCCRGEKNSVIIQVDPSLNSEQALTVFLHELGHARAGYHKLPWHKNHELPPGSYRITDREALLEDSRDDEAEADRWSAHWRQFAKQNGASDHPASVLTALMNWRYFR